MTIVSSIRYMIYEFYIKGPMQVIELKLKMRIDENPHLKIELDRSLCSVQRGI